MSISNNLLRHVSILYACVEELEVTGKKVPPRQVVCTATDMFKSQSVSDKHTSANYCSNWRKSTRDVKEGYKKLWEEIGFTDKCHTCEMLWSSLELTKPDMHHLHRPLPPEKRKICNYIDQDVFSSDKDWGTKITYKSRFIYFSKQNKNAVCIPLLLPLVENPPVACWTCRPVHPAAGSGRCPPC